MRERSKRICNRTPDCIETVSTQQIQSPQTCKNERKSVKCPSCYGIDKLYVCTHIQPLIEKTGLKRPMNGVRNTLIREAYDKCARIDKYREAQEVVTGLFDNFVNNFGEYNKQSYWTLVDRMYDDMSRQLEGIVKKGSASNDHQNLSVSTLDRMMSPLIISSSSPLAAILSTLSTGKTVTYTSTTDCSLDKRVVLRVLKGDKHYNIACMFVWDKLKGATAKSLKEYLIGECEWDKQVDFDITYVDQETQERLLVITQRGLQFLFEYVRSTKIPEISVDFDIE
jgi:hypothetical protein